MLDIMVKYIAYNYIVLFFNVGVSGSIFILLNMKNFYTQVSHP
jgi:hypothetical protein